MGKVAAETAPVRIRAGNCAECGAHVALRPDDSCPNCGLVDAFEPIPKPVEMDPPESGVPRSLKIACLVGAAFGVIAGPVLFVHAWDVWGHVDVVGTVFIGLLCGPPGFALCVLGLGQLWRWLPWLLVRAYDAVLTRPVNNSRSRLRTEPTFLGAEDDLLRSWRAHCTQQQALLRTRQKITAARTDREGTTHELIASLEVAEQGLATGIEARQRAMDEIQILYGTVQCHRFQNEMMATFAAAEDSAPAVRGALDALRTIETSMDAAQARHVVSLRPERHSDARRVWQQAKDKLQSCREALRQIETRALVYEAATLLRDVQPIAEAPVAALRFEDADVPDVRGTLFRLEQEVAQCLDEHSRVHAEMEALTEVEASISRG